MNNVISCLSNTLAALFGETPRNTAPGPTPPNYSAFLSRCAPSGEELKKQKERLQRISDRLPLVTVLLFANGCDESDASATVFSLTSQTYPEWELVLTVGLDSGLAERFSMNGRIRTVMADEDDGSLISAAEALIRGEYVLRIEPGDLLSPDALFLLTDKASSGNRSELVYADCDRHDDKGNRFKPRFKPAFSPVTEICLDYISRPLLVSSELYRNVGGLTDLSDRGSHWFSIRCCSRAKSASNVSRVLLSCASLRNDSTEKLICIGKSLEAIPGSFRGSFRLTAKYRHKGTVGIVIAASDSVSELRRCVEAIDERATYFDYKLIIASNNPSEEKLAEYLAALKKNRAASVFISNEELPLPGLNNFGAAHSFGEYLIFIGSNVEVITPDFIERLIDPLLIGNTAISGGKLIDGDSVLFHTGTVIGLGGYAGSPYAGTADDMADERKCFYTAMQRNVTAVSGLFMAIRSETFEKLNLFDETFSEVGWDADLCIRARKAGMNTVFTPFAKAKLMHVPAGYETASDDNLLRVRDSFREFLKNGDPYYSPVYDRESTLPKLSLMNGERD